MKDIIEVVVGLCVALLVAAILALATGEWVLQVLFD